MSLIKKSSVLVAVFLGMFAGSARAQDSIRIKVPFPFVVGQQRYAAGSYDLRAVGPTRKTLSIEGTSNGSHAFVQTTPISFDDPAGNQPALVFARHGDEYILTQIWESDVEGFALSDETGTPKHGRAEARPEASVVLTYGLLSYWK